MLTYNCINRIRDKNNVITAYDIDDGSGHIERVSPAELKARIDSGYAVVINLRKTSDGKLIIANGPPVNKVNLGRAKTQAQNNATDITSGHVTPSIIPPQQVNPNIQVMLDLLDSGRGLLSLIFKALNSQLIRCDIQIESCSCMYIPDKTDGKFAFVNLRSSDTDEDTEISIHLKPPLSETTAYKLKLGISSKQTLNPNEHYLYVRALGRKRLTQSIDDAMKFIIASVNQRIMAIGKPNHPNPSYIKPVYRSNLEGGTPERAFIRQLNKEALDLRKHQIYNYKTVYHPGHRDNAKLVQVMNQEVYLGPRNIAASELELPSNTDVVSNTAFLYCFGLTKIYAPIPVYKQVCNLAKLADNTIEVIKT